MYTVLSFLNKNKLVFIFVALGAFFRLYNLAWGFPFPFHPDENNISYAVGRLLFPHQFNPHFFAYGSLPIYTIFLIGLLIHLSISTTIPPLQAIIISRTISAIFSVALLFSLFYIAQSLWNRHAAWWTLLFAAFSTGFIQYAHFGTFEMWLTLFGVWLFYVTVSYAQTGKKLYLFCITLFLGILIGIKVSSIILIPLPLLAVILFRLKERKNPFTKLAFTILSLSLILLGAAAVFILTNPYAILDFFAFKNSITYETGVALGTTPVFYTQSFLKTIPILFHLQYVLPFLVSPFLVGLIPFLLFFLIYKCIQTKSLSLAFLVLFFTVLFVSQATLFVKWTRYLLPLVPFIYFMIGVLFSSILAVTRNFLRYVFFTIFALLFLLHSIYGMSYFLSSFAKPDARVTAATWAQRHIPSSAHILTEAYDIGILPFTQYFPHVTYFNFYDLDSHSLISSPIALDIQLQESDYILLTSQRLARSRLLNAQDFPLGNAFYSALFTNKLGFIQTYQTPCTLFCNIVYLGNPTTSLEETVSVFDRPTVFIFKKMVPLTQNQYANLLKNH